MNEDRRRTRFGRNAREYDQPIEYEDSEYGDTGASQGYESQSYRPEFDPYYEAPRKKRSTSARGGLVRFFSFLLTLALFGSVLAVGAIWWGKTQFEAPGPLAENTTFVVPKGASFSSIVPGLEKKNIIPKQGPLRIFVRGVQAAGKDTSLKAGEFAFAPGMSMRDVMQRLTAGKPIEYAITFPEGWTSFRIVERIAANEVLEGDVPPIPEEGTLLPETYLFQRGMKREELIKKMTEGQQKVVQEVWESRADGLPLDSPEDLVTLASIVEKETGVAAERPRIAAVFLNRLRRGMRLQTDPTVIYGIWGGRGKPRDRGGLRRSELDKPTAYNTYQNDGLPPGPIANPGIEALRAVANPATTDELFFVADGTGGHVFSKTLEEHNSNVAKWRVIEAELNRQAEEAAAASDGEQAETSGQDN